MTSKLSNKRISKRGDGWEIHEYVNTEGIFSRYTKYFYKGKRAPRIEMRGPVARHLAGYSLIEKDLRNVLIWLSSINDIFPLEERVKKNAISPDRDKFNLIKSLFVSSLVFYGKCFTQCDGRKIKLDRRFVEPSYRETHEKIMKARHNFAAHSGADKFEDVQVSLVLNPKKSSGMPPILFKELMQADMMLHTGQEIDFKVLTEHVQKKVLKKMSDLEDKIMTEDVFEKGLDYWYKRAKIKRFK